MRTAALILCLMMFPGCVPGGGGPDAFVGPTDDGPELDDPGGTPPDGELGPDMDNGQEPDTDTTTVPDIDVTGCEDGVGPGCFWDRKRSTWSSTISYADILMSPDGTLLALEGLKDGQLCLTLLHIKTGEKQEFPNQCNLRYVSFLPDSSGLLVLDATGRLVRELSVAGGDVVAEYGFARDYSIIDVSLDGVHAALSNRPNDEWAESQYELNTYSIPIRELGWLDREEQSVTETMFPYAIRDLDFSPTDGFLMVTMSWWKETGLPEAVIQFFDPATKSVTNAATFKNCADELMLNGTNPYAVLSPNRCFTHKVVLEEELPVNDGWNDLNDNGIDDDEEWDDDEWNDWGNQADPISIIELETQQFLGNIPGFGPVALTADGHWGLGFTRRETMMVEWNFFQTQNVGLIVVDFTNKFLWEVVEIGDIEPLYFVSPDSRWAYFYQAGAAQQRLFRMELVSRDIQDVGGHQVNPTLRAWTPDNERLYVVDDGVVYRIAHPSGDVVPVDEATGPNLMAMRPQGDFLVLGHSSAQEIHFLDLDSETITETISF